MKEVYVVAACRTATAKMGGALKKVQPQELSRVVMEELPKRAGISKENIQEVVWAQTRQSTEASNIGRYALLMAGYPETVPAQTIMSQCSSGMVAIHTAADIIRCGHNDVVVAGGVESLSNAIFYLRGARYGYPTGNNILVDSVTEGQINSQPLDQYGSFPMGITAENIAKKYNVTREDQDKFAYSSQMKCKAATEKGLFKDEIVPVVIPATKKTPEVVFDKDEFPKPDTTMEILGKLKPAFIHDGTGTVTAGNACGRNDGAAGVLLMSGEAVEKYGVKPIAKIIGQANIGCDPHLMGMGPAYAIPKAVKEAGIEVKDLGLVEINEAFAAQSVACVRMLGLDENIVNVNGGAIAIGHALGGTGARISVTLLYEMMRRGTKYGCSSLCVGGGLGSATVFELCK